MCVPFFPLKNRFYKKKCVLQQDLQVNVVKNSYHVEVLIIIKLKYAEHNKLASSKSSQIANLNGGNYHAPQLMSELHIIIYNYIQQC